MSRRIFEVSELNLRIKYLLEQDPELNGVMVRGEISNYKVYPSGHHYFTLKDAEGALRCVMFKREAMSLRFQPENGMQVLVMGRVAVYPRDGAYQLYCTEISPVGIGDLYVAFEQLKEKLKKKGLFHPAHKQDLPRYPLHIAVITSPAGAAVRDIIRVLRHRFPSVKITLLPVRVQGTEAPAEICQALKLANEASGADVIILGRGGGSIEDLWAFNDENVAQAIYDSEIPVITGIGHEPDVTIADLVADKRAATPSNAAELAVPDASKIRDSLRRAETRLENGINTRLGWLRSRLDGLSQRRVLQDPRNYLVEKRLRLDKVQERLDNFARRIVGRQMERFVRLATALDALSPLKVIGRGYLIAQDQGGAVVKSVDDVKDGDKLSLRLADGRINCAVEERIKNQ